MSDLVEETRMIDGALKDLGATEQQTDLVRLIKLINKVRDWWPDFQHTIQGILKYKVYIKKFEGGWSIVDNRHPYRGCFGLVPGYSVFLCDETLTIRCIGPEIHKIVKKILTLWPKITECVEKQIKADHAKNIDLLRKALPTCGLVKLLSFLKS